MYAPGSTVSTMPGASRCDAPFDLVEAGVVHVHAEPVAGAVHVELLVRAALEHLVERALAQAEVDEALREHALGDLVVVVELDARPHRVEARELRGEHHLVHVLLRPA